MAAATSSPLPLVVLISGSGSNLQAIMDACAKGEINAEVRAVISNRPDAYGLERARNAGIATHLIDHRNFQDRRSFENELEQLIDSHHPRLVVLAGFMRILTAEFVNHYLGRLINIHPSLLPNFQGINTHQRAIDAKACEHGVSVHFVTPELDGGPVIIRAAVPILNNDDAQSLAQRVLVQEHIIYPKAIDWYAEGRLCLNGSQAMLDNQPITQLEKSFA
jgi:phosphoribosylglycinamide formyltransferase-1